MNILYLEDNPNDAQLVRRYIATTPHQLVTVTSADEARTAVQKQPFDLILIDVWLGNDRGGAEFAQYVRKLHPQSRLVGVTALTTAQDMQLYRQIGFDHILAKPFTILELADLLGQYQI